MATQTDPAMLEQEALEEVRQFALALLTRGQQGEAPPWFAQLNAARALLCGPWELDEAFPDLPPATRAEWVRRAGLAVAAEHQAQVLMAQRQRAGAALFVPQ